MVKFPNKLLSSGKISYCLVIILTFLLIGYFTPRKWNSSPVSCDFDICVHDTGIHTNIIVTVRNSIFNWHNYLNLKEIGIDANENYQYLSFGWGDRALYMQTPGWENIDIYAISKRLFIPHPSVIYVEGYRDLSHLKIKCVKVDRTNYLQLMKYIKNTFQIDGRGKIRVGNGYRPSGGFYEARGSYSLWKNCNSWTAAGLRKADINTPLWDGLSSAIMWHLRDECSNYE